MIDAIETLRETEPKEDETKAEIERGMRLEDTFLSASSGRHGLRLGDLKNLADADRVACRHIRNRCDQCGRSGSGEASGLAVC